MSNATDLRNIFAAGRPLVERWLDLAEEFAALRDAATEKGLDWSQVKALLKAQVQDERDGTGENKRVKRIIERAEYASSYAHLLGLGVPAKMNENNFSAAREAEPKPATTTPYVGKSVGPAPQSDSAPTDPKPIQTRVAEHVAAAPLEWPDLPQFLDRRPGAVAS